MQAARAAGLYAIGVSWGRIHSRESLDYDADVIVDRAEELLAIL
jgi:phosphoglycolate phosphatase-like HAD superfamily hydrolase